MTDQDSCARQVANLWRVLWPDLPPGVRTRSDVRRLDGLMIELSRALRPPPLDAKVRADRTAVVRRLLAELGGEPADG